LRRLVLPSLPLGFFPRPPRHTQRPFLWPANKRWLRSNCLISEEEPVPFPSGFCQCFFFSLRDFISPPRASYTKAGSLRSASFLQYPFREELRAFSFFCMRSTKLSLHDGQPIFSVSPLFAGFSFIAFPFLRRPRLRFLKEIYQRFQMVLRPTRLLFRPERGFVHYAPLSLHASDLFTNVLSEILQKFPGPPFPIPPSSFRKFLLYFGSTSSFLFVFRPPLLLSRQQDFKSI